jgi:valyl-tRNA synthetase
MASPDQQNLPLSEEAIEAGRNFANKIWNAARLILRAFPGGVPALPPAERLTATERWLLWRYRVCALEVSEALDAYRISDAAVAIHRFIWSELCDWALEMEKERLYEGGDQAREDAANVLAWVLERTLRLLHPIMPFVTEEIWQRFGVGESIVIAPWPDPAELEGAAEGFERETAEAFAYVQELVSALRRFRSDHRIAPRAELEVRIVERDGELRRLVEPFEVELRRLAGVSAVGFVDAATDAAGSARLLVAGRPVLVPVGGLFDVDAERARLGEALARTEADAERVRAKLANPAFTAKAPAEVVEKERGKLERLEGEIAALRELLDQLSSGDA